MPITLHDLYGKIGLEEWEIASESKIELERFRAIEAGKENATQEEIEKLTRSLCPGQDYLTYLYSQKKK